MNQCASKTAKQIGPLAYFKKMTMKKYSDEEMYAKSFAGFAVLNWDTDPLSLTIWSDGRHIRSQMVSRNSRTVMGILKRVRDTRVSRS